MTTVRHVPVLQFMLSITLLLQVPQTIPVRYVFGFVHEIITCRAHQFAFTSSCAVCTSPLVLLCHFPVLQIQLSHCIILQVRHFTCLTKTEYGKNNGWLIIHQQVVEICRIHGKQRKTKTLNQFICFCHIIISYAYVLLLFV